MGDAADKQAFPETSEEENVEKEQAQEVIQWPRRKRNTFLLYH